MDASQPGGGTALQLRVGAFVLASLLVFTGLVYMLGRSAGLFERQYRLVASFGQIGGLIQGATVRLAGVPVGRVGDDPPARARQREGPGGASDRPARAGPHPGRFARSDRDARAPRRQDHRRHPGKPGCGGPPGWRRAADGGAVRHGAPHPAGGGAPQQPGRALDRAPDGPRGHHRELHRGGCRRDRAGAPESRDRDRARAGRPPPPGLRPEARVGARRRGRDAPAARAKPCAGSTARSPIPGPPTRR